MMESTAGPSNNGIHMVPLSQLASTSQESYYDNIEPDFHWIRSSIRHFIDLVSNHFDEFYDKTIKKKVLWKRISQEMRSAGYNCDADSCDKKWRNLKKTYVNVLQKQVKGDFSSKFPYFDQMHAFIGREIDPLGMREQGLNKAIKERKVATSNEIQRTSYYEVSHDDGFEWTESAVHLLLDLVLEYRDLFKAKKCDIDYVWENISDRMVSEGYALLPEQCQRKWANLAEGFRHYQIEGEVSGKTPTWTFFSRVRQVINTVNVPVTIVKEEKMPFTETLKGSFNQPAALKDFPKRRKRRREFLDTKDSDTDNDFDRPGTSSGGAGAGAAPTTIEKSLKELNKLINLDSRLDHLESRIQDAHRQRAATKQTNSLLTLILGELRRINKSLEEQKEEGEEDLPSPPEESDSPNTILYTHDEPAGLLPPDALLHMENVPKLDFVTKPKLEIDSDDNEGIIIVEGL